jgi:DNA-3-methyladenine glycosylase II
MKYMSDGRENLDEVDLTVFDKRLASLIRSQTPLAKDSRNGYFFSLCRSIIGQQVSVAAASAIFGRLKTETDMQPSKVAGLSDQQMRAIGLSRQKITYIRDLASHFNDNPNVYNHLDSLPDPEVIAELIAVKGIGVWTSQMFLIFTLDRPDVFPVDDVGIQNAMKLLYEWKDLPSKAELIKLSEKWQPYRTTACLHLWESLRNKPI